MNIGFIGLGRMGIPMSKRLIDNHFSVVAYDINPSSRKELANYGAIEAKSISEVARSSDIIILMLPNNDVIKEVILGEKGLYETANNTTLIIDMSSSSPIQTKEIGEILEKKQISLIDAPVSGGLHKAKSGELTIMIGGQIVDIERAIPILNVLGSKIIHVDELGSGHASKALNNLLAATSFLSLSEVMVSGAKFGIDPSKLLEVINNSSGGSYISRTRFQSVLERDFSINFTNALMYKDILSAIEIAKDIDSPSFLTNNVEHFFRFAASQLGEHCDYLENVKLLEQWAKIELNKHSSQKEERYEKGISCD